MSAQAVAVAKLTIHSDPSRAGRYTCIELVGEVPNARATTRRIDVDVTATLEDALAAYLQREGLTVVNELARGERHVQVAVR